MTSADSSRKASRSRGLSSRSRRLRRRLLASHVYAPHELEWLDRALAQFDLADECDVIIAREGLQVDGKAHPLLAVRRDALLAGARYWRQLKFEDAPAPRRAGRLKGEAWRAMRAVAAQMRRPPDADA